MLLLIVGIAFGAEWLVIRFFARPRTPPVEDDDEGVAQRAVRLVQRTLIDLAPVGAFALCGYAALGGRAGVVESMSIRSIRMRDLRGHVHTVPFGEVATVLNMTKDYSYAFIEAGVAYRENVDDVVEVLRAIGDEMQADEEFAAFILEALEVLGLDSFGASSVNIRVRLKAVPMKQWAVRREFQRRMKRAFDERGIEIPFPHQTVYFGVDKSGRAPSARIALENETRGEGDAASATPPEYLDSEFERLASLGAESGQPIRPERK